MTFREEVYLIMRNWIGRAVVFAALLLVIPTAAMADNIVFQIAPGSGIWSGGNSGNGFMGWTGTAGDIIFADGVVPAAVCAGPGCAAYPGNTYTFSTTTYLYFETSSWTGTGLGTVASPYIFAPGGAVYVYDGSNIWFLGTFTSAQMVNDSSTGGTINFSGNFVSGTLDATILSALGFPTNVTSVTGSITATFGGNLADGSGTTDTAGLSVTPVPEPGTLALFGSGLIGVAGLLRRKFRA